MARGKKPKIGDVFSIQINETKHGYGQFIVGDKIGCYVIFDIIAESQPTLDQIVNSPILFLAFTSDKGILAGAWVVVGNISVSDAIVIPEYKTDYMKDGKIQCVVEKYDGTILRLANDYEKEHLQNMSSYTPNVIEGALKARFGYELWNAYYNKLLYNKDYAAKIKRETDKNYN